MTNYASKRLKSLLLYCRQDCFCGWGFPQASCRFQRKERSTGMPWTDSAPISYLRRSDRVPFFLEMHGKTFRIGEGEPAFRVTVRGDIPKKELLTSTTLALGEAYMRGGLTVEGNLFTALCAILSQAERFTPEAGRVFDRIVSVDMLEYVGRGIIRST